MATIYNPNHPNHNRMSPGETRYNAPPGSTNPHPSSQHVHKRPTHPSIHPPNTQPQSTQHPNGSIHPNTQPVSNYMHPGTQHQAPHHAPHTVAGSHSSHVGFKASCQTEEYQETRKKYLTAKYGQHQMRLIRKRLAVEDWVDEQLKDLYDCTDDSDSYDTEIDLDELLDIDNDRDKRLFVQQHVADVRKSPVVVNKFIDELLLKAQTL